MNHSPLGGPAYLKQGFNLMMEPGLRLFVIIPLLINIAIFALFTTLTLGQLGSWISQLLQWLPNWLDFILWILWPLALILVLAVVMYLFSTVANLIAAPFNGLLAEKTEEHLTGREVDARETLWQALASFPRSLGRECRKLFYYLAFALLTLIVSFIVSPAAPLLWFCLNAWMMAVEYCDYPMDNHKLSFREARRRIASQRGTSFSFGALVMVGTMVPLLNLIIMPAAVCGGTAMWVDRLSKQTPKV